MKILFSTTSPALLRNFESVVSELTRRGHEVHIARHLPGSSPKEVGVVERLVEAHPGVTAGEVPAPDELMHPFALAVRGMRDYVHFLDPSFNASYRLRAERRVPDAAPRYLAPLARLGPLRGAALHGLDALSDSIPVDPVLTAYLEQQRPDLVLLSPYVGLKTVQPAFARAAQALGIPTVVCVASWDNLSSKSQVWPAPEMVTVWNEIQREEAATLHGLDPSTVAVTGAQLFDQWFERTPRPRAEFLARVGLPADRPVLLYVCSSPFLDAPPETGFVRRWIEGLRASSDPALAGASVLVRPHPKRAKHWQTEDLGDLENAVVHPPLGALVVGEEASQDYFDSLHHSAAVVGLNTSAMIEAGIVGRPVHTQLVPEYEQSQQGTFHFRDLVEVGGGLLRVAADEAEHHRQLAESVARDGERDTAAEEFVRTFVRPAGIDVPATPRFADAIEEAGRLHRAPRRANPARRLLDTLARPLLVVSARVRRRLEERELERKRARKARRRAAAAAREAG